MTFWWQKGVFMTKYVTEERFDASMANIDARFDRVERRIDNCVTKDEFHSRMDEVVTILRRLDQERVFTTEWIRRIESDVDRVKKQLKLA